MFKDREPIKKKPTVNWEEEYKLQQYFVNTIQTLSASPINIIMSMEQIFQYINKKKLEMTYILG
jgi:hypothetical protein